MRTIIRSIIKMPERIFRYWSNPKGAAVDLVEIAKGIYQQMAGTQLFMIASSLSYTTMLSIIPALAVSFATFKAFGGMDKVYSTIEPLILQNLAEGSIDAMEAIRGFIANIHTGAIGIGGFIALVFTSMTLLFSIEKGINQIWRQQIKRGWLQRVSIYWLLITMGPLALSVAIGAATSLNLPLKHLLPSGTGLFMIATGIFFLLFKWVPHRPVNVLPPLVAAVTTAFFWNFARMAYTFYTKRVLTYDMIYGSLGAVPILMLWIYIVWVIVLGGAALTAVLQKRMDFHKAAKAAAAKG